MLLRIRQIPTSHSLFDAAHFVSKNKLLCECIDIGKGVLTLFNVVCYN